MIILILILILIFFLIYLVIDFTIIRPLKKKQADVIITDQVELDETRIRSCPYCGEEILTVAKKCKHCGEWLNNNENSKNEEMNITTKKNHVRWITGCGILVFILLLATLPFHYIIRNVPVIDSKTGLQYSQSTTFKVYAKDNFTFSNTFIFQEDIDKLIDRYNNASYLERQAINQESFMRKLMEKGIIVEKNIEEENKNTVPSANSNSLKNETQTFEDEDEDFDRDFFSDKDIFVDGVRYKNYFNSRYHFTIDYPADFIVEKAPFNGDGRRFSSKNATLTASCMMNVMDWNIKEDFESSKESKHTVTYERISDNWYVLSGYDKDGKIYYTKTIYDTTIYFDEETEVIVTATLKFDASEKPLYDKIVLHVFNNSLKVHR